MNLTLGHIFYIPAAILLGVAIGWLLCSRLAGKSGQMHELERSKAERSAHRAVRIAERRLRQDGAAEKPSSKKNS